MSVQAENKWYLVANENEVPFNEGRRVRFQDYDLAVFNLGDKFRAIDNACPHKQGPLADGIVAGDAVFCPLHTLKISLGTGCALNDGEGQVKTYPVQVLDGKVYVAFEQGKYEVMNKDCASV